MIIAIDSGNTSSKIGVFKEGKLVNIFEKRSYESLIQQAKILDPDQIIIATVNYPLQELIKDLSSYKIFSVTNKTLIPIKIKYNTPETLGIDRIALSVGAWNEFPNRNILIIDSGTCITYDFVNSKGYFLGGGISPGMDIKLKSLHQYTANLPLVKLTENPELIGDSTENSILSGVVHGTYAEISGIIKLFTDKFTDIIVVFSGGNVKFFETKLKDRIFAIPNLVLRGLYSIFLYNDRKA